MSRRSTLALLVTAAIALAGCSDDPEPIGDDEATATPAAAEVAPLSPELASLTSPTTVVAGATAADLAVSTSQALYAEAPLVVLAPVDDIAAQGRAASLAVQLGVPVLLAERPASPAGQPAGGASSDPTGSAQPDASAPATSPAGDAPASEVSPSPDATLPPPSDTPTASGGGVAPDGAPGATAAAVSAELERLGTTTVLDVGSAASGLTLPAGVTVVAAPDDDAQLESVIGMAPGAAETSTVADVVASVAALDPAAPSLIDVSDAPAPVAAPPASDEGGQLPPVAVGGASSGDLLVLATADPAWIAATATARAAGARVQVLTTPDPRSDAAAVEALAAQAPTTVLALGDAFGTPESLRYRLDVAATGVELPGGGQVLFPGRRMVALYGNPTSASLGVLGEQPLDEAITRAQRVAAEYDGLWGEEPVVPAFEVIATVASAFAGPDGNYSTEMEIADLQPYVDAAKEAGVYVVLDLQPGRTDFLTQAKIYESLLVEPNVGLALDPEWRLEPGQVHLEQIGSVSIEEVNAVGTWLADLTRANNLPQKLLLLHQFRLDMIEDRDRLDTSRDELSYLIHADGNGSPGAKYATYGVLTDAAPANVWWGWKNFYDEDSPTFTPAETAAVDPSPVFVSYQ